jgi:hypothetical protein
MKKFIYFIFGILWVMPNLVSSQTRHLLQNKRFETPAEKMLKAGKLEKRAQGIPGQSNPVFSNRTGAPSHSTTAVTLSDLGQSVNQFTNLGSGRIGYIDL